MNKKIVQYGSWWRHVDSYARRSNIHLIRYEQLLEVSAAAATAATATDDDDESVSNQIRAYKKQQQQRRRRFFLLFQNLTCSLSSFRFHFRGQWRD